MADTVMRISGVDIVPYIGFGGLEWQRADVDGPNAGRALTGDLIRNRITTKYRCNISCRPLLAEELSLMLQLIKPATFTVEYTDEETQTVKTGEFYSNNFSYGFLLKKRDGRRYWRMSFPLIMV